MNIKSLVCLTFLALLFSSTSSFASLEYKNLDIFANALSLTYGNISLIAKNGPETSPTNIPNIDSLPYLLYKNGVP